MLFSTDDCISGSLQSIINVQFGSFIQPHCSGGGRLSYGSGEGECFHKFVTQHVRSQCLHNDVYVGIHILTPFPTQAADFYILIWWRIWFGVTLDAIIL